MSVFSHKCNIIRFHSMNFIIALTAWVCHAQILRKLNVYARIRKICSDSFVKHVTACDCSLKKRDVRVEILFQNRGGKNLNSEQRQ